MREPNEKSGNFIVGIILILIGVFFVDLMRSQASEIEVQGSWSQDCYGTRVTVEQLGVAHFQVFCNGLVVDPYDINIRTFYETFGNWQGPPQVGPPVPTTTVETD